MLYNLILNKAQEWLGSDKCTIKPVLEHVSRNGNLREAQAQALLTYLFLKIEGGNKPLWQLFSEGFFCRNEDLSSQNINQKARSVFETNGAARALFELSRSPLKSNGNGKKKQLTLFPDLEKYLIEHPNEVDYSAISKSLFYNVEYADFLFSLPMGAGKTYLMAAIIYLDLYFVLNEPDNKSFAHNFLILAPSGLKSSIIPSLKTIERFDPSWILPEPSASAIKRMIKFEVLDQPKAARKSNKARNPNAQKIANYQPFDSLMGLVMVVNAEKVILDRLELSDQFELIEKSDDERDCLANELRNIIGKIPNLQIHIDEVHHAATDDIKLRQVVNKWSANGSINSVLGFSGTPYLSSGETVKISDSIQLKSTQIANTVFYYPLTTAVRKFLKKPRVEQTSGLTSIQIIEKGVRDFLKSYGSTVYENGAIAKLAIYCGSIERLEEEVYGHLTGTMKINPDDILKYHRGNKKYKLAKEAEAEFNSLDTPLSKKRIILLVQIGKEGWDCRSLTGVILSQKGDCPANMVLQTSCRCLRQVDKGKNETALIWLNEENAKTLDKQLKDEQHTSIQELNNLRKDNAPPMVERFSRMDYLKLPNVDFYQLNVEYETLITEKTVDAELKLKKVDAKDHFDTAVVVERGLNPREVKSKSILDRIEGDSADFEQWVYTIARESMGSVSRSDLHGYADKLNNIFETVTFETEGRRFFNNLFRQDEIRSRVRLAFHRHRELNIKSEIIPRSASLLLVEKMASIDDNDKVYPVESDVKKILQADATGQDIASLQKEVEEARRKMQEFIAAQQNPDLFAMAGFNAEKLEPFSGAVAGKDRTFHYLPYNFSRSRFELNFLKEVISLSSFIESKLEIYYNGERHLTDFRIACFSRKNDRWHRVGAYTPDFLVIKRNAENIHKILIVETKGSGFAEQPEFKARRNFVEAEFLKMNNDKFGYSRFDYLYIPDDRKMDDNLLAFKTKIESFFRES